MVRRSDFSTYLLLAGVTALVSLWPGPTSAQESLIIRDGEDDYRWHCVACHGEDGRGRGEMAGILAIPPADLTRISQRHGGVFPFWQAYAMISGEFTVAGHQTFQMPRYWERFGQDDVNSGFLPAHIRILLLTHYLESIQVDD